MSLGWPRWLVVESADEARPIGKLSPFAIQKQFKGISKDIDNIKRLRSGAFLVECTTKRSSLDLQRWSGKNFVDRPVKVSVHASLNSCRGVIRCRDLAGMSEADIKEELQQQGVTQVHRVTIKKSTEHVPTNTYFLTFCTPKLPEHISVGYLRVKVTTYVPSPLRCFKCQKYGHGSKNCRNSATCPKCGCDAHDGECSNPQKCINCKGDHSAASKECPSWRLEAQIQKVRAEQKISFVEARKLVVGQTEKASYASKAAAATATKEMTCQTDLTWVKSKQPQLFSPKVSRTPISSVGSQASAKPASPATRKETSSEQTTRPKGGQTPMVVVMGGDKKKKSRERDLSERMKKAERDPVHLKNRFELLSSEDELDYDDATSS